MSYKNIKIRHTTWQMLLALQRPGETFDQLLQRLITELEVYKRRVEELEQRVKELESKASESVARSVDAIALDKAAWYAIKLAFSVQSLKDLVDSGADKARVEQQKRRVLKVLDQISERYGVKVDTAKEIIEQYVAEGDTENKILVNEMTKEVVKSIILKLLELEALR